MQNDHEGSAMLAEALFRARNLSTAAPEMAIG